MNLKAILITLLFISSNPVLAEPYALLVGVSEYENPAYNLQGPENDINSLRKTLIQRWGFSNKNITLLKNQQATRSNIKTSLKQYSEQLTEKDYFVFFFSGHGTSRYDLCNGNKSLSYETGALVPYDINNPAGLFVTKNDLRPYLEKMDDKGVNGMGLIDACFSGNSYRSITSATNNKFSYRYAKLPGNQSSKKQCRNESIKNNKAEILSYPYKNFVFMTASSAHEKALDLDANLQQYSFGKIPHGAFTSSVLFALNNNKPQTHESFFMDVEQMMSSIPSVNHSPLLFPDEDVAYEKNELLFPADYLYNKNLFNKPAPESAPESELEQASKGYEFVNIQTLIVDIPKQFNLLQDAVKKTQGLLLNNEATNQIPDYSVSVDPYKPSQLNLMDIHNIPLFISAAGSLTASEREMAGVLRQQYWLSQFRKVSNPQQPFEVRIRTAKDINSAHSASLPNHCKIFQSADVRYTAGYQSTNETFIECDVLQLSVKVEKKSFLVVLDLNAKGHFALLYPHSNRDRQPVNEGNALSFYSVVEKPFGTDSIVVFAFSSAQDPLYKKIVTQQQNNKNSVIKPGSFLHQNIVQRFMNPDGRHAQHIKNIVTIKKQQ